MSNGRLCFFDMDNTLIGGNSGISFMRYSFQRKKTTRWRLCKAMVNYLKYRYDLLDMEKAYKDSLHPLVGVPEDELRQFCRDWFEERVRGLIYTEMFEIFRQHRDQGESLAVISNSMVYTVEPLAQFLGIPYALATRLEIREGRLTGDYVPPLCFRQGKVFWAEKLAEELGADLRESTFYTDSITDLPLLERVQNPRVVNPDPRLRLLAKKRGWPVVEFSRKKRHP